MKKMRKTYGLSFGRIKVIWFETLDEMKLGHEGGTGRIM